MNDFWKNWFAAVTAAFFVGAFIWLISSLFSRAIIYGDKENARRLDECMAQPTAQSSAQIATYETCYNGIYGSGDSKPPFSN